MVTFLATISMLQSAIQIAGDGGARLKLDLDDTQMDAIVALSAMRGQLLTVTVEPEIQAVTGGKTGDVSTGRQRKPRWTTSEKPGTHGAVGESGQQDGHTA
jgi:hypothetical protein